MTLKEFQEMVNKYVEEHPEQVDLEVDDGGDGVYHNKSTPQHPNHPFEVISFQCQYWGTEGYK